MRTGPTAETRPRLRESIPRPVRLASRSQDRGCKYTAVKTGRGNASFEIPSRPGRVPTARWRQLSSSSSGCHANPRTASPCWSQICARETTRRSPTVSDAASRHKAGRRKRRRKHGHPSPLPDAPAATNAHRSEATDNPRCDRSGAWGVPPCPCSNRSRRSRSKTRLSIGSTGSDGPPRHRLRAPLIQ